MTRSTLARGWLTGSGGVLGRWGAGLEEHAGFKGFCGEDIKVNGAGRTDAGVHALGQVAHVDLPREVACDTLRDAVNAHMRPHPVAIVEAEAAIARSYHSSRPSVLARLDLGESEGEK